MVTQRTSWAVFKDQMKRLAYLPGYERLEKEHWAEIYMLVCGFFPHELALAVRAVLLDSSDAFFPKPGRLVELMQRHRREVGGHDWDSTLLALEAEARGEEPPALPQPVDFEKPLGIPGAGEVGR